MGLDPQAKDFLEQQSHTNINYDKLTAEDARNNTKGLLQ